MVLFMFHEGIISRVFGGDFYLLLEPILILIFSTTQGGEAQLKALANSLYIDQKH